MLPAAARRPCAWIGLLAAVCVLAVAGCGGDDGEFRSESTTAPATETEPANTEATGTETTDTDAETEPRADRPAPRSETDAAGPDGGAQAPSAGPESPEDQPGGAGDEIPAEAQAAISGEGGALSPGRVRVPPFIAVRIELRSVDGATYRLSGGGKRIAVGGAVKSASAQFAGLRPGKRLILSGPSGRVVVEPSAEPGP